MKMFKDVNPGQQFTEDPVDHDGIPVFLKIRTIIRENGGEVTAIRIRDGMPFLFRDTDNIVLVDK